MYSKSKYVVGDVRDSNGFECTVAIVFSEVATHSDMARIFVPGTIIGAGFCHFTDDDVEVYGESVSLKLKSSEADKKWVGRSIAHPKYIC